MHHLLQIESKYGESISMQDITGNPPEKKRRAESKEEAVIAEVDESKLTGKALAEHRRAKANASMKDSSKRKADTASCAALKLLSRQLP